MAGANTARGAQADADAENSGVEAQVEVSDSGVSKTKAADDSAFKPVKLAHPDGREAEATSVDRLVALKFDGYREPKSKTKKS